MMWKTLALIACALLWVASLPGLAQEEPPADEPSGSPAPSGASSKSADELQREALRSLMGDNQKTETPSHGAAGTSKTGRGSSGTSGATSSSRSSSPAPDEPSSASSSSSSRPSSRRSRSSSDDNPPSSFSVPEVPAEPAQPAPDAATAQPNTPPYPTGQYPGTTQTTPGTPVPDGTTPSYDSGSSQLPETYGTTGNALAPANAEAGAPARGSSGSAIIIGLIILAVLLVALAAVVGVMAAHRSRPAEPLPGAQAAGWAYFTAPNAPNIGLQKAPFLIGSSQQCDLVLADPKASPEHARVDRTPEGYVLTDLNSLNGTYLNGQRIASPVVLRAGDEVRMGDIAIAFEVYV